MRITNTTGVPPFERVSHMERERSRLHSSSRWGFVAQHSTRLARTTPSLDALQAAPAGSPAASPPAAASTPTLGTWEWRGPGNVGGRTRALLIVPGNPNTMYAAGVSGGVWKTTNAGGSWTPLQDMMDNTAVNSMAMDPHDSNVIYAGTGEGYFSSYPGVELIC